MSLGHADAEVSKAVPLDGLDLLLGGFGELDSVSAVHLAGDSFDLLGDGQSGFVEEVELRSGAFELVDDRLGEFDGALTAEGPVVGRDRVVGTCLERLLADKLKLGGVSVVNWLMATITLSPNFLALAMCLARLTQPLSRISRFSSRYTSDSGLPGVTSGPPPCVLSARTVATITAASGTSRTRDT